MSLPGAATGSTPAARSTAAASRTALGATASPRQVGNSTTIERSSYGHAASRLSPTGRRQMTVHITSVALSFGADQVLDDVSAIVRPRDRIALVGRNGAGKTTLLRMVAGELAPERGDISVTTGTRIALHDQRPPLASRHDARGVRGRWRGGRRTARNRTARAGAADGRRRDRCGGDAPLRRRPARVRAGRRLRLAGAAGKRRPRPGIHARRSGAAAEKLLRGRADPSVADPRAGRRARRAAAGRAHQPPRYRRHRVAGGAHRQPRCRCAVRLTRPLVSGVGGQRRAADRARPGPVREGHLLTLPAGGGRAPGSTVRARTIASRPNSRICSGSSTGSGTAPSPARRSPS